MMKNLFVAALNLLIEDWLWSLNKPCASSGYNLTLEYNKGWCLSIYISAVIRTIEYELNILKMKE